jgi:hypothetical protein
LSGREELEQPSGSRGINQDPPALAISSMTFNFCRAKIDQNIKTGSFYG